MSYASHMSSPARDPQVDQLLVARFKSGDDAAFNEIIVRYRDLIFGRVYGLLKNREDAEEITQDTFLRAHRGLENFRGDSSLSTWIYQIATNLARNRYWYWFRRKRDRSLSIDASLSDDSEFSLVDILPSGAETPREELLTQEFVDRVSEKMELLSAAHREILLLRNRDNLSYEEIAERLGISLGTVKSRIARARDSLKELMGTDFHA